MHKKFTIKSTQRQIHAHFLNHLKNQRFEMKKSPPKIKKTLLKICGFSWSALMKHTSNTLPNNGLITSGGLADLLQTMLALDLRDNTFTCARVSFCLPAVYFMYVTS